MEFRLAEEADVPEIVSLLAEIDNSPTSDNLSKEYYPHIERQHYLQAFREISADCNNELIVGVLNDKVVAVFQITYIPNLTLGAVKRALIEGVRVSVALRGQGLGKQLMEHAISRAKARGCKLIQLTTNSWRQDAIDFYKSLGFQQTHIGLRMEL